MHCLVCCRSVLNVVKCSICLKQTCKSCIQLNEEKCCFCNSFIDSIKREIGRQMSLLAITKADLQKTTTSNSVSSFISPTIKKCPVCNIYIEKEIDDCPQIYCINCKTVWSWTTMNIVTDINLVHNAQYFSNHQSSSDLIRSNLIMNPTVLKCLNQLDKEEYRYTSDMYIYRVNFLNEQIDLAEFHNLIEDRFKLYNRHIRIGEILEKYTTGHMTESECELELIKYDATLKYLPYI